MSLIIYCKNWYEKFMRFLLIFCIRIWLFMVYLKIYFLYLYLFVKDFDVCMNFDVGNWMKIDIFVLCIF